MKTDKNDSLIEIFAGTSIDAEIVQSVLNDSNIETFLKDDHMGTLAPWQAAAGGAGAVKVVIKSSDYELAKSLVEQFEQSKLTD